LGERSSTLATGVAIITEWLGSQLVASPAQVVVAVGSYPSRGCRQSPRLSANEGVGAEDQLPIALVLRQSALAIENAPPARVLLGIRFTTSTGGPGHWYGRSRTCCWVIARGPTASQKASRWASIISRSVWSYPDMPSAPSKRPSNRRGTIREPLLRPPDSATLKSIHTTVRGEADAASPSWRGSTS
jgi:hypothetical protein